MRLGACGGVGETRLLLEVGFDFVEPAVVDLLDPRLDEGEFQRRKREFLTATGGRLSAEVFNRFYPAGMRITGPEVDMEQLRAYAAVAARRAVELGGEAIVFGSGGARKAPPHFDRTRAREQLLRFLTEIAPVVDAMGVSILIEPLGPAECNLVNTLSQGLDLMRRLHHEAVGLLADSWHIWQNGEDLDEITPILAEVSHVHIADPDGRSAPVVVKQPLADLLSRLKRVGYDGRITVECRWSDLAEEAPRVVEAIRRAWEGG